MKTDITIGDANLYRIAVGMSKIGTFENYDVRYVENRINIIGKLTEFGRIFVDTSPIYGDGFSETVIGAHIRKFKNSTFIATKYYPEDHHTKKDVVESVTKSLSRLQVENIDLLQLHWPNPLANIEGILEGVEFLIEQGDIGNFGVCNFSIQEIKELRQKMPNLKILTNQIELNLTNLSDLETTNNQESLTMLAYGVLLQGKITSRSKQYSEIFEYGRNHGISPAAVAVGVILAQENQIMPILKISSIDHLNDIMRLFEGNLDSTELLNLGSNFRSEIRYVDPDRIILIGDKFRRPYITLEDALLNREHLFPSPVSLAARILKLGKVLPLKVRRAEGDTFQIDYYDPFDQIKKYWAWRIAYPGYDVPVLVIEDF